MERENASTPRFAGALRRARRLEYYALIACSMFVAAVSARSIQAQRDHSRLNFIFGDARGYYIYLPSALIDGDLDFSNQMAQNWGAEQELSTLDTSRRTATGLIANKYPVGMAMTLLP